MEQRPYSYRGVGFFSFFRLGVIKIQARSIPINLLTLGKIVLRSNEVCLNGTYNPLCFVKNTHLLSITHIFPLFYNIKEVYVPFKINLRGGKYRQYITSMDNV